MINNLLDEIGEWWLPVTPEIKIFGIIKLDENKFILELKNNLEAQQNLSNFEKHEVINGNINGKLISLVNIMQITNPGRYIFAHGFIGQHFINLAEMKFSAIESSFDKNFSLWLHNGIPFEKYEEENKTFKFEHKLPEPISYNLDNSKIKITFKSYSQWKSSHTELNYNLFSLLCIKYIDIKRISIDYVDLLGLLNWFERFLTLCCLQVVEAKEIFFIDANNTRITYFWGQGSKKTYTSPFNLINYKDIKENLGNILDYWFENKEKLYVIGYIITELIDYNSNIPLELKFTQAVQALESYHRHFYDLEQLKEIRKQEIKPYNDLLKSLLKEEKSEIKNSILSKLKHAHEPILRDRLTNLISKTPNEIISLTILQDNGFAGKVTEIRNYYTHWDKKSNMPNYDSQQIHDFTETLKLLILICIFQDLQVPNELLIKMFKQYRTCFFNRTLIENSST